MKFSFSPSKHNCHCAPKAWTYTHACHGRIQKSFHVLFFSCNETHYKNFYFKIFKAIKNSLEEPRCALHAAQWSHDIAQNWAVVSHWDMQRDLLDEDTLIWGSFFCCISPFHELFFSFIPLILQMRLNPDLEYPPSNHHFFFFFFNFENHLLFKSSKSFAFCSNYACCMYAGWKLSISSESHKILK